MAYDKFKILKSSCIPLPIENIDTDQIIPARFLKAIERLSKSFISPSIQFIFSNNSSEFSE